MAKAKEGKSLGRRGEGLLIECVVNGVGYRLKKDHLSQTPKIKNEERGDTGMWPTGKL